jgi:hypothetical protein
VSPSVFVSYTRHDQAAARIAQRIASVARIYTDSYDYMSDPRKLREGAPGGAIKKASFEAMGQYDVIVLVISRQYFSRPACLQEYTTALTSRLAGRVIAVAAGGPFPRGEEQKMRYLNIKLRHVSNENDINSLITTILH